MSDPTARVDLGGKNHAEVYRYTDDVCRIVYCPGNSTRYDLVVVRVPSDPVQWLASFPALRDGGSSYWLGNAYMHASYVYQKWPSYAQADIPHMTRMLRLAQVEMGLVDKMNAECRACWEEGVTADRSAPHTCAPAYVKEKFTAVWEGQA